MSLSTFEEVLSYFFPAFDLIFLLTCNLGILALLVYMEYQSQETLPQIEIYPITQNAVYYSLVWLFPQNLQLFTSVAYILYYH